MMHLLDMLFRFPADKTANSEFIDLFLNLVKTPILVVDSRLRRLRANFAYEEMVFRIAGNLSRQARQRNLRTFLGDMKPQIESCLEHGRAEFIQELKLPVAKGGVVDAAICPGQMLGVDVLVILALPPGTIEKAGAEGVADVVFDSVAAGALTVDCSLRYQKFNRGHIAAFRLDEKSALGRRASEVNPSGQGLVLERQFSHVIATRSAAFNDSYPVASVKRGTVQAMVMAWPLVDLAGECSGAVAIIKPSSEPKVATGYDESWERILGRTVDAVGPPSFFTHVDGRIVFMTGAAEVLVRGLAAKEQINLKSDLPWANSQTIAGLYEDVSRGPGFSSRPAELLAPSGKKRPFRVLAYGIRDLGDIVSQVFVILLDSSEMESYRRLMSDTTRSLAGEKAILERVVETLDMPMVLVDSDLVIHRVNNALARRVFISPDFAVGKPLHEIVATARQTGMIAHIKEAMEQGRELHIPRFEHITRAGVTIPMDGHLFPVVLDGKPGCLAIVRELVEQERLEALAARWVGAYNALASGTQDGVVVIDRAGIVLDLNPAVAQRLGGRESLIGKHFSKILTVRDTPILHDLVARAFASKKPTQSGPLKLMDKATGESFFVNVSYLPVPGSGGDVEALVMVTHWGPTATNLPEEITRCTDNLQNLVGERTKDLASASAVVAGSADKITAVAKWCTAVSLLKDGPGVLETFIDEARRILGADFACVKASRGAHSGQRRAYCFSGKPPSSQAIPGNILDELDAYLTFEQPPREGVRRPQENLVLVDFRLGDRQGLFLAWRQQGAFDPIDGALANLIASRLGLFLLTAKVVGDLEQRHDRSECLRRVAVRVAGALTVGVGIRAVADEVSRVIPAERIIWVVRGRGDEAWLSVVYSKAEGVSPIPRRFGVPDLARLHSAVAVGRRSSRLPCGRPEDSVLGNHTLVRNGAVKQACPFREESSSARMKHTLLGLLEDAGLASSPEKSFAVAPVVLSEGSFGLICVQGVDSTPISAEDTCFLCLAASTLGYVWQAADAASSVRRLEATGETLSDLAHDLRRPLNRMMELLKGPGAGPGREDAASSEGVRREAEKLTLLVQELTEMANHSHRRPEIVDLEEIIEYCASVVSGDLAAKNITLSNQVGSVPPAYVDRGDLTRIILAVVANSADAVGEGGTIEVSAEMVESDGGVRLVGLVFEDSGPGVPEGDRDKIFDAFFTTKPGGTGLGLFSAKKRAKANGGDIVCEAGDHGRSRFVAMFPIAVA